METILQLQQHLPPLAFEVFRLSAWLVALALLFVPLERLFAQHRQRVLRKGLTTDLGYYFLNSVGVKLILIVPMSALAFVVHRFFPTELYTAAAAIPVGVRLLLAMVVGELSAYWAHRMMHTVPFLWRFHAIHHSAEELDWLVNTRAHPLDMAFARFFGLMPVYVLGLAQPSGNTVDVVPMVYALIGTVWSFLIHANLRWRFGWIEQLVSTPAFHHWHHTKDGAEYVNKNYAAIFPWVDRLFGTYYLPKQWPTKYGIDTPMTANMAHQLLDPFVQARSLSPTIDQSSDVQRPSTLTS